MEKQIEEVKQNIYDFWDTKQVVKLYDVIHEKYGVFDWIEDYKSGPFGPDFDEGNDEKMSEIEC